MDLPLTTKCEGLGLEYLLERREVDDQQLTHDGATHGVEEHTVTEETNAEYALGLQREENKQLIVLLLIIITGSYTGWPIKNGMAYFQQYVDAITGISVRGNFSWEKLY